MKGSSISIRIADFLKDYPPFEFLPVEVLRALASKSKVKFHEDEEFVFSQGQPRDQWLYVIQQGNVRVLEETEGKEKLIDLRGPGDLLGLNGIRSDEPYIHTAKTESETILYGLPRDEFVKVAETSTKARRYLAAYFSLNPAYHLESDPEDGLLSLDQGPLTLRRGGLSEVVAQQESTREALVVVRGEAPLREVALRLQSKGTDCVVVVDASGKPIGKLTDADMRDRIIEGEVSPETPVQQLMYTDLFATGPEATTGDLLLKLTRHGKKYLVVTEDGTLNTRATGLVTERNLFLQYGRFPTVVGDAIESAPDVDALRGLRDRLEALILEFLNSRRSLIWLMELIGILNRKFNRRSLELSITAMQRDGLGDPPGEFCWLLMGSGGRNELLIRSAVYHALVFEDPRNGDEENFQDYFRELARRTAETIRLCGFLESPQNVLAQHSGWCLSLSRMKERFSRFIKEPVRSHVYSARDAFDFQPAGEEPCPLARELSAHIDAELADNDGFIRHMASDSLMNQPPRTIFKGYVVDKKGIRRNSLAIKSHALLPLVDVARVLTLEVGSHQPTGTYERLKAAADRLGLDSAMGSLLKEASEAFLVAQYARISQGLRKGTDGAVINPGDLDPETRTLLITAFRTIFEVLEATASRFELEWSG